MTPFMPAPWAAAPLPSALQVLVDQLGWPAAKDAGDSVSGQSTSPAPAPIIQGPGHRPALEEFQAQLVTLQVVRLPLAAKQAWILLPGGLLLQLTSSYLWQHAKQAASRAWGGDGFTGVGMPAHLRLSVQT